MKIYYRVFRPSGNTPNIKHATYEDAQREAERVAKQHPAQCVEVLACVSITQTQEPIATTFFMDGVIAEI